MLINKIKLKNFKQYKDETINLPMGLTGLVGKNGAGKSTIFDAITFAFFGTIPGVSLPLLRNDNSESSEAVEVEMNFTEKGCQYNVKRSFKGVNVTSKAALYKIEENENGNDLTTIAQSPTTVNSEIYKIINLDRVSFVNSFFARQKETAGLVASSPLEREVEIRKMLGFDRLDTISKKVGDRVKIFKYEIDAYSKTLLTDEKIVELNDLIRIKKIELENLNKDHDKLMKSVSEKVSETEQHSQKVDGLKKLQKKHNLLEKEIATTKTAISKTEESISSTKSEISRLENLKIEAERLSPVVQLLQKLKSDHAELQIKKDNATLYSNIKDDQTSAELTLSGLEKQIETLSASIVMVENAPQNLQLKTTIKEGFEREVDLLNSNALDLNREIDGNEAKQKEMVKRLKHVEGLDDSAPCPECERELGSQKPLLIQKYKSGIADLEKTISEIKVRKSEIMSKLEAKRKEFKDCNDEIVELGKSIVQLKNDKKQSDILSLQIENTKEKIANAKRDILAVGPRDFDNEVFNNLNKEIKGTEKQNEQYQKILGEIGTLPNQLKHLSDFNLTLSEYQSNLSIKQKEIKNLNFDADLLTTTESLLKLKQKEHLSLMEETHKVELNINSLATGLSADEKTLKDDGEKKNAYIEKQKELDQYKTFKEIIDNFKSRITSESIPKISQEANQLFVEITKERYSQLYIDKGSFEIKVRRDDKEALIETLSGGEKDLAAVCLRIAISRHIISMSGAGNLGFLALDEVFGSQDEGRRQELMFALAKISEWFKQVFIVAHNQDVEEAFPNRMIISKKGLYSSIDCKFNNAV